eukprot:56526-Prorocentrum_minimum.AAC.1
MLREEARALRERSTARTVTLMCRGAPGERLADGGGGAGGGAAGPLPAGGGVPPQIGRAAAPSGARPGHGGVPQ